MTGLPAGTEGSVSPPAGGCACPAGEERTLAVYSCCLCSRRCGDGWRRSDSGGDGGRELCFLCGARVAAMAGGLALSCNIRPFHDSHAAPRRRATRARQTRRTIVK